MTREDIKDNTEMGEQTIRWDVIEDVAATDQYLFIIIRASLSAFGIPRRAFVDEADFNRFKEAAIEYHQAAKEANI